MVYRPGGVVGEPAILGELLLPQAAHVATKSNRASAGARRARRGCCANRRTNPNAASDASQITIICGGNPGGRFRGLPGNWAVQLVRSVTSRVIGVPFRTAVGGVTA